MSGVADHLPLVDAGLRIEVFCNREKTEEEYSWNRQVISGIYHAKSISGGRLYYEKTVQTQMISGGHCSSTLDLINGPLCIPT